MSRKAYSDEDRAAIRRSMLERSALVFADRGLRDVSLEEIYVPEGISKTFFYSFFPSKVALITEVFRIQSAEILETMRSNVWEYGATNGMRATLSDVLSGRWYIASFDDQQYLRGMMSEEEFVGFKNDRIVLFAEILNILGVPISRLDPRVFYNMLMSVVWAGRSGQSAIPFLYGEVASATTEIQIDHLVEFIGSLSVNAERGGE